MAMVEGERLGVRRGGVCTGDRPHTVPAGPGHVVRRLATRCPAALSRACGAKPILVVPCVG
jgi:hypothetical protein